MKMATLSALAILVIGIIIVYIARRTERTVDIRDIQSGQILILGRLGVPVGSVVRIEGTWRFPPESVRPTKIDNPPELLVDAVQGKRLKSSVKFTRFDLTTLPIVGDPEFFKELKEGKYTFIAFEKCQYLSIPPAAWEGKESPIADYRTFGIYSQLTIVRIDAD